MRAKYMMSFMRGLLISSALVVGILMLMRIIFTIMNVPSSVIAENIGDIPMVVYNALRFDLQITAYVALLPTVIMLIQPLVASSRLRQWLKNFCSWYYMVAIVALAILSAIDLFYFINFNSHISIIFFDFFDEEPLSLIQTIWDDYPVVWMFLGVSAIGFIAKKATNWAYSKVIDATSNNDAIAQLSYKALTIRVIIYLAVLVVFLRGSVGRFPLNVEDLVVSTEERINNIIPNAPYMLKKAMKEKSVVFDMKTTQALLKEYGFKDLKEAFDIVADTNIPLTNDTLSNLRKVLFSHAGDTLKHKQPNILLLCCESWSNYLLHMGPAIQCGMEKHFAQDIVFDNFQSVRNGTIATIENITVSTPYPRVFRSVYRKYCLPSSIAIPFINSGYSCEFLSGMDLSWENCNDALKMQKFSKLTGKFEILKEDPKAEYNSIGVYDEYMLNILLRRLNNKTAQPQMIMAMTTTNHPPLDIPSHANVPTLPKNFCKQKCFNNVGEEVVEKYLKAFQYFDICLVHFLDEFKKSPAAENTIIMITGDHNVRSILNYNVIGKRWQNSVPLYIYLPPYLRGTNYPIHPKKWGCHYDMVATLAPFAFKNTDYMKLGNNLLDKSITVEQSYSYNEEQTRAENAYLPKAKRITAAREMLLRLYFQKVFAEIKH